MRVGDIEKNPLNFRKHPELQRAAFAGVVEEIGFYGFPDVYKTEAGTFRLIDGELRQEHLEAKYGPDYLIEVNVTDFDEAEAAKALATHDPLSALATTDSELLGALVSGMQVSDLAMAEMLRSRHAAAAGADEQKKPVHEDEVPEPPKVPITKPGDLWSLGDHRLLCGDSTREIDVRRLMGDFKAGLVFSDPPYNVDYVGKTKAALKIENDKMEDGRFRKFLHNAFANAGMVSRPGCSIYICHADSEGLNFRAAMISSGWLVKQCLIWVKNSMVMGRQDYQWKHEPILYGWRPGAGHRWFGGRKQTTVIEANSPISISEAEDGSKTIAIVSGGQTLVIRVPSYEIAFSGSEETDTLWRIDRPSRSTDHPTMKPVAIPHRAILNSSERGDVVLDMFGGSGSTMSACEQAGRRSFSLELDPRFCDVIVARWEALSGKKATVKHA